MIAQAGEAGRITVATNMAGRGTDIKPEKDVLTAGGLHVILTEYHESARIDRQLFGRSARQGQPGSVQAIVSLEDETFKRYAPNATRILSTLSKPDSPIQTTQLKTLKGIAQVTAEGKHRRMRLHTLVSERKRNETMGFVGAD